MRVNDRAGKGMSGMDEFGSVADRMNKKLGSKFLNSLRIKTQFLKRLQRVIVVSKLHVHSVNFVPKLVHTRRALSSTVINSHQKPVSGQACNPLDPHWFFLSFSWWRSLTVLGTKVAPFP